MEQDPLPVCELCGEETEEPEVCADCGLLLCQDCEPAHDCDGDE